ncbi:hypothetical protein JCM3765_006729 [Sporobolomyces pararoseus]
MGFCRRCGEIVSADSTRCKCGGTSRDSTTKILFGEKASDKWSQRYLARSSSPTSQKSSNPPSDTTISGSVTLSTPETSIVPPPRPPPSPSKLAHSFLRQSESEDTELSCVFGSVLSPKDHWQCSSCETKFRQEEVIYPHPDAKSDPAKFGELYFCRKCFAERFSLGNCKKCKLAVLSDAKFIKHEKNLWHEPCYVCSYCPNFSQTSVVIDFAARPSCEDCFDSFAYKTAGILPSPHLSQTEFSTLPVEAPPPPNKWGRPSMSGGSSVWSSRPAQKREEPKGSDGAKGTAWRIKRERENSPLVHSYDELGEKMKRFGITTNPASTSRATTSNPPSSTTSRNFTQPQSPSSNPASSGAKPFHQTPQHHSVRATTSTAASNTEFSFPGRSALKPIQSTSISPVLPSSPTKTSAPATISAAPSRIPPTLLRLHSQTTTDSPKSITLLDSDVPVVPSKPSPINDQEICLVCARELGYGQFVELASGTILHLECFACDGCRKSISGKYVETEGKAYHRECAPALQRYRAIVTSLAAGEPYSSSSSSASSASLDTHRPKPFTSELPASDEPSCSACSGPLGYGLSVTLPRTGRSYHNACFTCAACSRPFEKGFIENGGLAYHEKCLPALKMDPGDSFGRPSLPPSPSRTSRPARLPSLPSFPPQLATETPSTLPPRSLFSTRQRPPSNLGGLLICAGCSVRATEKETVLGPGGRRYHRKCLVCGGCKRELDSEVRGGETGILRCEACRKLEARTSYRSPALPSSVAHSR